MSKYGSKYGFARAPAAVTIGWLLLAIPACQPAPPSPPAERAEAAGGPVAAVDDVGREVRLDRPARRVVSLLPATTETLVALGARDLLVARTDYDDPHLSALPSVGGGLTPNLELLVSLRPDLVVAWEEAGAARVRPRLESLGIPVFAAQTRDTADIYANVERLGHLVGRGSAADSLAASMRAALDSVRASVADRPRPTVLYLTGVDPPIVAGPHLFIGEILELAGGTNAFPELRAASPQVSVEEILRRRPDVVLVPASGVATRPIDALLEAPGWSDLFRDGGTRLHALPADVLHRPGPSVVDAARMLRDLLHPEAAGSDAS